MTPSIEDALRSGAVRLVPVEATTDMRWAGWRAKDAVFSADAEPMRDPANCYTAMLSASPDHTPALVALIEERDRLKVERDENFADARAYSDAAKFQRERAEAAEADLRGCKIALDLAWASNREREAKLAAAHTSAAEWKLVPIEPTREMERAGDGLGSANAWYAMLNVAPTPPVFEADEGDDGWRNVRIGGSSDIVDRLADESDPQTIAMEVVAKMRSDATALIAAEAELAKEREQVRVLMKTMAAYSERALAAEAKCDALREALRSIHNCGQSAEPDHWKFRCMARDTAIRALTQETANVGE